MVTKRVHLTFSKEAVRQPIIWQVGQEFEVVMNIRRADVQHDMGWVELEMEGDEESIAKAMKAFQQRGVRIDPIELQTVTG
ncbi:MAG: FeS-binding protein [Armatimonadetes bacterium]|nr:FeS-binding protein [Armatimonadota bacterium]HOC31579.1 NIL domain-containing protein [Armatimonadota bacterium]